MMLLKTVFLVPVFGISAFMLTSKSAKGGDAYKQSAEEYNEQLKAEAYHRYKCVMLTNALNEIEWEHLHSGKDIVLTTVKP